MRCFGRFHWRCHYGQGSSESGAGGCILLHQCLGQHLCRRLTKTRRLGGLHLGCHRDQALNPMIANKSILLFRQGRAQHPKSFRGLHPCSHFHKVIGQSLAHLYPPRNP